MDSRASEVGYTLIGIERKRGKTSRLPTLFIAWTCALRAFQILSNYHRTPMVTVRSSCGPKAEIGATARSRLRECYLRYPRPSRNDPLSQVTSIAHFGGVGLPTIAGSLERAQLRATHFVNGSEIVRALMKLTPTSTAAVRRLQLEARPQRSVPTSPYFSVGPQGIHRIYARGSSCRDQRGNEAGHDERQRRKTHCPRVRWTHPIQKTIEQPVAPQGEP